MIPFGSYFMASSMQFILIWLIIFGDLYANKRDSVMASIDFDLNMIPVFMFLMMSGLSCQSDAKTGRPAKKESMIVPAKHSPG